MAPLLAIETSGQSLGVALCDDSGLLFEENVTEGMVHGRALAPLVDKALASRGLKVRELAGIAVSLGPGSWTGLRIGLSAAKAMAWGAGVALVGVPSFEALAEEALRAAPGHGLLTVRDARSEGFFFALFRETPQTPERLIAEDVAPAGEVLNKTSTALKGAQPLAVCGDAACLKALAAAAGSVNWREMSELSHIPARATARCGWRRLKSGDGVWRNAAEIHRLAPLYLRASDPELKLARKA